MAVVTLTLLHNPHCSTSVYALDALQNAGRDFTVRKYLLVAERLSEDELRSLAERLGRRRSGRVDPARQALRAARAVRRRPRRR